ncbi:hypothetical protein [Mucilaginibacter sp.]
MKKLKIIAAALIVTCACEHTVANTGSSSQFNFSEANILKDTVPRIGTKSPTGTPMPTMPTTTTPMPAPTPVPSPTPTPTVPPTTTPVTPTPNPTSTPIPVPSSNNPPD